MALGSSPRRGGQSRDLHSGAWGGVRGRGWASVEPREVRLDIRKTFLPMWTVEQWHRLPRDEVQSPSSEDVKTRLGKVLSISEHPALSGRLGWRPPEVSSNMKYPISLGF